jgi:hypothetical protein
MVGVAVTAHTGVKKLNHTLIVWEPDKCAKTSKVTRQRRALRPRLVGGQPPTPHSAPASLLPASPHD